MKRTGLIRFIMRRQGWIIATYCVVTVLIVIALVCGADSLDAVANLWSRAGAVLGMAALGVALLVWWGELKEDWEESLPKRLSAVFYLVDPETEQRRPLIICLDATLGGPSDIRAMAQQIGRQIAGNDLALIPQFEVAPPVLDLNTSVRRYRVSMLLHDIPEAMRNLESNAGRLVDLRNGRWTVHDEADMTSRLAKLAAEGRL